MALSSLKKLFTDVAPAGLVAVLALSSVATPSFAETNIPANNNTPQKVEQKPAFTQVTFDAARRADSSLPGLKEHLDARHAKGKAAVTVLMFVDQLTDNSSEVAKARSVYQQNAIQKTLNEIRTNMPELDMEIVTVVARGQVNEDRPYMSEFLEYYNTNLLGANGTKSEAKRHPFVAVLTSDEKTVGGPKRYDFNLFAGADDFPDPAGIKSMVDYNTLAANHQIKKNAYRLVSPMDRPILNHKNLSWSDAQNQIANFSTSNTAVVAVVVGDDKKVLERAEIACGLTLRFGRPNVYVAVVDPFTDANGKVYGNKNEVLIYVDGTPKYMVEDSMSSNRIEDAIIKAYDESILPKLNNPPKPSNVALSANNAPAPSQ